MDDLKGVIAEWVLTNGKLEGFHERVQATLPLWNTVGPSGMVVYRAQGGSITQAMSADPSTIVSGLRPVMATSKDLANILRYSGDDCCLFIVNLSPGVRYIDVNQTVLFQSPEDSPALAIKNEVLEGICQRLPPSGTWPTSKTPAKYLRKAVIDRCAGRTKYTRSGVATEYVPPENEIMVYVAEGSFSAPVDAEPLYGKRTFVLRYVPTRGGYRGRTYRRKPKRMNKNGSGPSRKSKRHVRDRDARNS